MKKKVYIETSIPSFYYEVRTEPEMIAMKEWTRKWWDDYKDSYLLVTSEAVLDELKDGDYPNKDKILNLANGLPLLPIESSIVDIVETYIKRKVMPADPVGDALHLALASHHKCDFLLTWNCNHIANANKFDHIRRINTLLGLYIPSLVTPLELQWGKEETL